MALDHSTSKGWVDYHPSHSSFLYACNDHIAVRHWLRIYPCFVKNVIDEISGAISPDRRWDRIYQTTVALTRPLSPSTRLELRWSGRWQQSNVSAYDYDRHIFGLYLRAETR